MATATPRSFSRSRSSESVMSLLAATAERISSGLRLDPLRMVVAVLGLGLDVALAPFLSTPSDCTRRADAKPLRRRSTRQPALNRANDTPLEGQRIRIWPCTPASVASQKHESEPSQFGNPPQFISAENAPALDPLMLPVLIGFLVIGAALPVLPLVVQNGFGFGPAMVRVVAGCQFIAAPIARIWAGRAVVHVRGPKWAVMIGPAGAALAGQFCLCAFGL